MLYLYYLIFCIFFLDNIFTLNVSNVLNDKTKRHLKSNNILKEQNFTFYEISLKNRFENDKFFIQNIQNFHNSIQNKTPNTLLEVHEDLINFHNSQFIGTMKVGNPSKEFNVVFDTGSSNVWIPSIKCTRGGCVSHKKYDPEQSTTFKRNLKNTNESIFTFIQYGTGTCILEHGYDDIYINNLHIKSQDIGMVVEESLHPFSELPFDGIIGLGFADPDFIQQNKNATPLIETIKKQNLLKKNIFSFYVPKDIKKSGAITFGKANKKYALNNKIEWFPVISIYYWEVHILDIKLFDKSLSYCDGKKCRAAIDTGSSLITGPSSIIQPIIEKINLNDNCSNKDILPNIFFVLKNIHGKKVNLEFTPEDYIIEQFNEETNTMECAIGMMPLDVPAPRGPIFVFGNTFIRKYYTIFDNDHKIVGLVEANHNF